MRRLAVALALSLSLCASPVLAGDGKASWWGGPVAATHDCVWPWRDCAPRVVTSLKTRRQILVTPAQWCQCYVGTTDERLIDLTLGQVRALGLNPANGLFDVSVETVDTTTLPNTATR